MSYEDCHEMGGSLGQGLHSGVTDSLPLLLPLLLGHEVQHFCAVKGAVGRLSGGNAEKRTASVQDSNHCWRKLAG